jgi:hypothetical protein
MLRPTPVFTDRGPAMIRDALSAIALFTLPIALLYLVHGFGF